MKKIIYASALLTTLLISSPAQSDVRFIVEKGESYSGERNKGNFYDLEIKKLSPCEREGYMSTDCPEGYIPAYPCPYNSKYFQNCCPEEYRYTAQECAAQGKKTGTSCGGKYVCRQPAPKESD